MRQVILNDILKSKPYPEAGTDFCAILREAVQNADTLQIDMTGVDSIPTMFMTTSFGCIMQDFGAEKLKNDLQEYNKSPNRKNQEIHKRLCRGLQYKNVKPPQVSTGTEQLS